MSNAQVKFEIFKVVLGEYIAGNEASSAFSNKELLVYALRMTNDAMDLIEKDAELSSLFAEDRPAIAKAEERP